jgi:ubiquinone/menaquinone biosynthesis C-methylase UbiE
MPYRGHNRAYEVDTSRQIMRLHPSKPDIFEEPVSGRSVELSMPVTEDLNIMAPGERNPSAEFIQHYQQVEEDSRLRTGWFQLEFARTQELILRHLAPARAVILDAGGGSGAYAGWLASLGHEVHLIDPVPKHVEQAFGRSASQQRPIASMRLGDARKLEQGDRSVDAVLLLGPLYHLTEREDRLACLKEAFRVLRTGGIVFAAAISRFASLLDSLAHGFFDQPDFAAILERDLRDGQHLNSTGKPEYFTTAYFHRPDELAGELSAAGFRPLELTGIEGPGWLARDFDRLWANSAERERLLECVRQVEHDPALLGASSHIMAIGKK